LASQQRGEWVSLDRGRVTLAEYAPKCIVGRVLRPRTREGYESNLKLHILPVLGEIELRKLNTSVVRQWHAELIESKSRDKAAKCYRLLRSILATAVEDRLIASNPAAIKKAGIERHPERPIATVAEVLASPLRLSRSGAPWCYSARSRLCASARSRGSSAVISIRCIGG
jgi:hypothetical protein